MTPVTSPSPTRRARAGRSPVPTVGGPRAWTALTCAANSARPITPSSALAILAVSLAALVISATLAAGAQAASTTPWWRLDSTIASSPALAAQAEIVATATDLGDGEVNGATSPVVFSDVLPEGLTPVALEAIHVGDGVLADGDETISSDCSLEGQTLSCRYPGTLAPYERLMLRIRVLVTAPGALGENLVTVTGANAASATLHRTLRVPASAVPLGVENYELTPEEQDGSADVKAGSHPFQLTTTLDFNQTLRAYIRAGEEEVLPSAPAALPRNLHVRLPPGLLGDASAVAQCSVADFSSLTHNRNLCPSDTAVGVASVNVNLGFVPVLAWTQLMVPVFNLKPAAGEPARFGFEAEGVSVVLKTALPAGGGYPVDVSIEDLSQVAQILSSQVTLWGVPGDPAHDSARGWQCLGGGDWVEHELPCPTSEGHAPKALLTLPSSCAVQPPSTVEGESWPFKDNGTETESSFSAQAGGETPTAMSGCSRLPFAPSIAVQPEQGSASTPTGLNVTVRMPQEGLLSEGGLAEPALRDATVTLPAGLQINPSAAHALEDCSASAFGFLDQFGHPFEGPEESLQTNNQTFESPFSPAGPTCPDAAKLGTVSIQTPLLTEELTGSVYLAAQDTNPFKSPLVLYLLAEDRAAGVQIKLAGEATVDEQTGQLSTTFHNTPQAGLFTQLTLHLFGAQRSSLSTPPGCGAYTAEATFAPWSGQAPATPSSTFEVTSGPGGGPCPPSPLPFAPALTAGTSTAQAGAFSSFAIQIARPDGQQQLTAITVHMPPGVAGLLSRLTPCPEPPVGEEWSCGSASEIGETSAVAGVGSEPFTLPGKAYLTSGYDGAPFGVLVQTPAVAGPFNLGMINVRSKIEVNPETADVTITTDPGPRGEGIPSRLKGIPADLQQVRVDVDRPEFLFNPTDCDPFTITGSLAGAEGAASSFSYPFQVSNCATLPFHPTLTASAGGRASKVNGTSFVVDVTSQGLGVANIAKVDLQLPEQLPSRLTTIQKACVAAVFQANPASCDEGSVIGYATIHTPIFKNPLTGPAYLVSHGAAAFPDVEFVLQGEGVKIVLDGKTDIKKGITYSRFESAPDAPFTSFETVLPAGPHSALTGYASVKEPYNLCSSKLVMPTVITGQNGAVIEQQTKIAVGGCGAVKAYKVTLAQRLAKALAKCRSTYKHSAKKRAACERKARATYTAMAIAACRKADKHSSKKRKSCEADARKAYAAKATSKGTR